MDVTYSNTLACFLAEGFRLLARSNRGLAKEGPGAGRRAQWALVSGVGATVGEVSTGSPSRQGHILACMRCFLGRWGGGVIRSIGFDVQQYRLVG